MHRRITLAFVLVLAGGFAIAEPASSSPRVRVLAGSRPGITAVFPSDRFTVPDPRQRTGLRVLLPVPRCTARTSSTCDTLRLLNRLDGFDIRPRVFIPFSGPIDVHSVGPRSVWVHGAGGRAGLIEVVWDPKRHVLEGTVDRQLAEDTRYTIVVTRRVRDTSGRPIASGARVPFTTESASRELDRIRRSLDSGAAYRQAGIGPAERGLSFRQGKLTTVFEADTVVKEGIQHSDQTRTDPKAPLRSTPAYDTTDPGSIGWYVFGSYRSPQFVTRAAYIPQGPTRRTPRARSAARLGFAMILPKGSPPDGGWPVAIYGPGLGRSYFDLYVTADHLAAAGIAVISIDPLGHGFGPRSTITVNHVPAPGAPEVQTTFRAYGRGRDLDGNGRITSSEGVGPTDRKVFRHGKLAADHPSPYQLVGLRDGVVQTTADVMALVRAIERGVSVPTAAGPIALSPKRVQYYGLSFGGIYGTALMGTDPDVRDGFLNSGGGPILDIFREAFYRSLLAKWLRLNRPGLLNGGPGLNGFTESEPDPTDPPITHPAPGSFAIRRFLAYGNWLDRPGSPETFAPYIRLHPRHGRKVVEFQNAFGDASLPNIFIGDVIRAGRLSDRLTYYRNDKTPTSGSDPHAFLADPRLSGNSGAEAQLAAFLQSYGRNVIDPDGPGQVFMVPIGNRRNLWCLHYAEPQTGRGAYPPPASGPCGPVRPG
jgi:hypothetical protein